MITAERTELISPISRSNAKQLASRIWDRAIDASGLTNEDVAQQLYVGESRIRQQRSVLHPDAVASLVDLVLADEQLFQRTLLELVTERRCLYGALPAVDLATKLHQVLRAGTRFAAQSLEALEHFRVEATMIPILDARAADEELQLAELRVAFRAHSNGASR